VLWFIEIFFLQKLHTSGKETKMSRLSGGKDEEEGDEEEGDEEEGDEEEDEE
jgi:hypothetical protein